MITYVALLRAVNVGGTGLLSMKDLVALAEAVGLRNARTYIQSGNLIFESDLAKSQIQDCLAQALHNRMGRKVGVILRTPAELRSAADANPFPDRPPARVAVIFLPAAADPKAFENLLGPAGEEVRVTRSEIYIYYPEGLGRSKLKVPAIAAEGTARNVNTVRKLVSLCTSTPPTVKKRHEK